MQNIYLKDGIYKIHHYYNRTATKHRCMDKYEAIKRRCLKKVSK